MQNGFPFTCNGDRPTKTNAPKCHLFLNTDLLYTVSACLFTHTAQPLWSYPMTFLCSKALIKLCAIMVCLIEQVFILKSYEAICPQRHYQFRGNLVMSYFQPYIWMLRYIDPVLSYSKGKVRGNRTVITHTDRLRTYSHGKRSCLTVSLCVCVCVCVCVCPRSGVDKTVSWLF